MGIVNVRRTWSDPRVRRSVFRILRENVLCSMATVARGNRAHINAAYFCFSADLDLYFLSDPTSVHVRNLESNRSMSVSVFRSAQRWGGSDRGLQMFGACAEALGAKAKDAEQRYRARFPSYRTWTENRTSARSPEAVRLRTYRFFRFRPTRIKILDESEFGGAVLVNVATRVRR